MSDFDQKYNILDEPIPPNTLMTARYKQSFAHYTLRERLPVILTQVIDNLSRDKDLIATEYGEEAREELKEIVGKISKLKYELQTDKEISSLAGNEIDTNMWNIFVSSLHPESKSYFSTCWLYAECYMYRRLKRIFECSNILKDFDYFRKQKENALICCTDALISVVESIKNYDELKKLNIEDLFYRLIKLNLWGNRCDLSISEGKEVKQTGDPFKAVDSLDECILIDDTKEIWNCISQNSNSNPDQNQHIIAFVCDNAGYELFTDFIIADFLIEYKLATKIRFYVKRIPWFISDVTINDFNWALHYLSNHESEILQNVGRKWLQYVKDGKFELCNAKIFWTGPYEFYRMKEIDKCLYDELSEADLIIFKGDLNYRKLIGDFTWKFTENFKTCLRGFLPTNLCTLRSVKADLVCGLQEGTAEILFKRDPEWMITGEYGVIQFAAKDICNC